MSLAEVCAALWIIAIVLTLAGLSGEAADRDLGLLSVREQALRLAEGQLESAGRQLAGGQSEGNAIALDVGGRLFVIRTKSTSVASRLMRLDVDVTCSEYGILTDVDVWSFQEDDSTP